MSIANPQALKTIRLALPEVEGALSNIPWQDRPANSSDVLWRCPDNPVIPRSPFPTGLAFGQLDQIISFTRKHSTV